VPHSPIRFESTSGRDEEIARRQIGDLPPGINVLSRFAAADAEGPVVVEQHHEAGVSEGLGEPCDAVFLHAGVAVGHRDGRATLRIALRKIEPGAKFYAVVDKSDFTAGGHRDLLIAFSAKGPALVVRRLGFCSDKGITRQDDFAKRPILRQMAQGFARLAPALHDYVHDIHQHGLVMLVQGGGS
jgi:hypothetical protein